MHFAIYFFYLPEIVFVYETYLMVLFYHVMNHKFTWGFIGVMKGVNHWWRFREPILFDGSPFNPYNLLIQFTIKTTFFPLSIYLQIEVAFFICTVNYVLIKINKCGSLVNSYQLYDAKLSTQFIFYIHVSLLWYEEICKGFCCNGYLIALQEILEEWRTGSQNLRFWVEKLHCTKLTTNVLETIFTNASTILALFRIIIGGQYLNEYESPVSEEVLPFMVSLSSPTRESLSPWTDSYRG